jgi:hypothetical protein
VALSETFFANPVEWLQAEAARAAAAVRAKVPDCAKVVGFED